MIDQNQSGSIMNVHHEYQKEIHFLFCYESIRVVKDRSESFSISQDQSQLLGTIKDESGSVRISLNRLELREISFIK